MKLETWMYKQTLELYPRAYREQFGQAMLETYTDALRAAKLEGEVFEFHKLTIVDTVRGIFRATIEIEKPDLLARVTAILAVIYICIFMVGVASRTISPQFTSFSGYQLGLAFSESAFYVVGFMIAGRRPFSEWLYFAIAAVGFSVRLVLGVYLATFNWNASYFPDIFHRAYNAQSIVSWVIFLSLFLATFLRSREQKRVSRLIWLCLLWSLVRLAYAVIVPPVSLRNGLHIYDILYWLVNVVTLSIYGLLALKFAQRSIPTARVVTTT